MKKILLGLVFVGFAGGASAQTINFNTTTIDYGTIKKGSDGNKEFIVKNIGKKPLIISNVKPSCGCTSPSWTREPIAPGKTGKISVHYNTNLVNLFMKNIEVYSNDPENSRTILYIKGNVVN